MILKHGQETRLVPDIRDIRIMQIIQSPNESLRSAHRTDQFGLVVRDVEGVFPEGTLESLHGIHLQRADRSSSSVDITALQRILEAPGLVHMSGLEEAHETRVFGGVDQEGSLVGFVEVGPVIARPLVFLSIGHVSSPSGDEGDAEVVVAITMTLSDPQHEIGGEGCHEPILQRPRNRPRQRPKTFIIEIRNRDVIH